MAQNRVIKSFTLDADVAAWLEAKAEAENRNFSNFMETWALRQMAAEQAATNTEDASGAAAEPA